MIKMLRQVRMMASVSGIDMCRQKSGCVMTNIIWLERSRQDVKRAHSLFIFTRFTWTVWVWPKEVIQSCIGWAKLN